MVFLGNYSVSFSVHNLPKASSNKISKISSKQLSIEPTSVIYSNNKPNVYESTWFSNPYIKIVFI